MNHLRFANADDAVQRAALLDIVRASPVLMQVFHTARDLDLPDWWIVSGAIYNQVWNHLTDRPEMYGVKDIDFFYFDPDTSFAAEDRIIKRAEHLFSGHPPVETRNQARVHLWYENHFGQPYSALKDCAEAIDRFACRTHCVGLNYCSDGEFDLCAPFGLNDIFSFRVTPNPSRNNRATHQAKGRRQKVLWPELDIIAWPPEAAK